MGTTRIPNNGHGQPDIVAGPFAVEVKARESLPQWLLDAVSQAKTNAGNRTPVVVLALGLPIPKGERRPRGYSAHDCCPF
jgi:hypothetical protein